MQDVLERPMTEVELEEAKQGLLNRYYDPRDRAMNDAVLGRMFAHTLHHAPDTTKLALWNKDAGFWREQPGGEFEFSEWSNWTNPMLQERVPLGGFAVSKSAVSHVQTKDILDVGYAGSLIPQGIVPQLFVWLASRFQAWQQIQRVPANGVSHQWRNLISLGDANAGYLDEDGCPPANRGVYTTGSTNIAILGLKRTTSLKLQLLQEQIGFRYGGLLPSEVELQNMMTSRARIAEKTFYQGVTASGHTGIDEFGTTFVNGFNGMRALLSNTTIANGINPGFYPTGFTPIVVEQSKSANAKAPITDAIDTAIAQVYNLGGVPDAIHMSVSAALKLKQEYEGGVRTIIGGDAASARVAAGFQVTAFVSSIVGEVPITIVPDQSIGNYPIASIATNGGTTSFVPGDSPTGNVMDIYVLSTSELAFPYIGSPDPLPIEVPIGLPTQPDGTGCLSRDLIVYLMLGLAVYNPVHQAKVRILA